ncbi:MAG: NAD(P)/FAD-dependent oxidoreductase [Halodesulfovibrio sp.]|uniref:NAD(P)/FAD-dependent oxidoreductase n=1 Tax=Halodesulfovibrio sp. TaxID=1912772 RepID=UPI00359D6E27
MTHPDFILIGSGMMGMSIALHLSRAGKRVVLLEKDTIGKHASGVNAGGIRSLKRDADYLPLIHGSLDMWHNMEKVVGSDCGFYQTGYLIAAENANAMRELEERAAETHALGYTNEILIDKKQLKKLAPIVKDHCIGGIMSGKDGHSSPAETCCAFYKAIQKAGAVVHSNCEVLDITNGANGFTVRTSTHGTLHAEQVINCAGAWAGRIAAMVGDELPITPVGASVMVTARMPRLLHHFVSVQGRRLWFNQARNGTLFICGGYLADINQKTLETRMNFRTLQTCVQVAHDLFDIAEDLTIVRSWAGADGETPDLKPIISRSPFCDGMTHVCGFSKHGFALSPMVGKDVSAMLLDGTKSASLAPFKQERFEAL